MHVMQISLVGVKKETVHMGKEEAETDIVAEDPNASCTLFGCCTTTTCKRTVLVILGVYVLIFALWFVGFGGHNGNDSKPSSLPPWMPHVEASFRLRRSVLEVNESISQLQTDLQNEIGIPDTQIDIVSIAPLSYKNWTEVRFTVSPDSSDNIIATPELSLLKDTFVELFMQRSANLSLTSTVFGKVSHFQVLHFPGGITVVPPQPGFPLSKVLVLFNFTLHDSLTHVNRNFAKFRQQLADGMILKPNESLFVQLTNVEGSTVNSPVVVQTSILPVVGAMLPSPRLRQLAWEIINSPKRNLGLNHTLFGRVKKIQLSSYLEYSLESAPTPSPSPSPAPSVSPCSLPAGRACNRRHRGFRRHRRDPLYMAPRASPQEGPILSRIAPTPQSRQWQHQEGALPPIYAPLMPRLHFPPAFSPTFPAQPPASSSSASSPAAVPSGTGVSHPLEHPPSADSWPLVHIPTSSGSPSEAPIASLPPQLHERITTVPVASPLLLSSAIVFRADLWAASLCMALLIGFW